jgi:pimeloyl-ACP methyl ester carboxylesterase
MSLFVLLHGAWHGGWSWSAVQEHLAAAGHRSVAPDLPCDDVNAGWNQYADAAMSALEENDEELVLVGHSLAGGVVPVVATRTPVTRLVLLCAAPPIPGTSLDESLGDVPDLTDPQALRFRDSIDAHGRYVWPDFETARLAMYADCDEPAARLAYERLRPQATKPFSEPLPIASWPDVPLTFVVCADDRMGRAGPLRELARRRFGLEAVELPGGHSPFLSRPLELTRVLLMDGLAVRPQVHA